MPENEIDLKLSDVVQVVNLKEESFILAKLAQKVPEGTKIRKIEVLIDGPGGGGDCGVQFN